MIFNSPPQFEQCSMSISNTRLSNVAQLDPPLTAGTGGAVANGPFYAGVYDGLGRQLFAGVTVRFRRRRTRR